MQSQQIKKNSINQNNKNNRVYKTSKFDKGQS